MSQPFNIDQYRWLGQCSPECIETYHPYDRHHPFCDREKTQDLIDEIDRLNALLEPLEQPHIEVVGSANGSLIGTIHPMTPGRPLDDPCDLDWIGLMWESETHGRFVVGESKDQASRYLTDTLFARRPEEPNR